MSEKIYADRKYVESLIGSGGGVSSWNDLKDKPFYEEINRTDITWDGNTEGKDVIGDTTECFVYMSDLVPEKSELIDATITGINRTDNVVYTGAIGEDDFYDVADGCYQVSTDAEDENANSMTIQMLVVEEPCTINELYVFDKAGIYFNATEYTYTNSLSITHTNIQCIDKKFIPEDIDISWENISDKPFYEYINTYDLIIEREHRTYDVELGNGYFVNETVEMIETPVVGCTYSVSVGETYAYGLECKAFDSSHRFYGIISSYIGNLYLATGAEEENTGENVLVLFDYMDENNAAIICEVSEDSYTAAGSSYDSYISGPSMAYKTIDEKYLPGGCKPVDTTLKKSGYPADAATVGEILGNKQPVGNYATSVNGVEPYGGAIWVAPYKKRTGWEENTSGLYVSTAMPGYEETDTNAARYTYIEIKPVEITVGDTYKIHIGDCKYVDRGAPATYINRYTIEYPLKQIPGTDRLYVGNASYMGYADMSDDTYPCIEFHHNNNVAYAVTIYHGNGRCLTEYKYASDNFKFYTPVMEFEKLDKRLLPDGVVINGGDTTPKSEFILNSSTEGSTKQFKITIDDTGTLTIAEIVEEVE